MIRCVLIDDEENALRLLQIKLSQYENDLIIINSFTDTEAALFFLQENEVDIVFLDMNMPKMSGLELLAKCTNRKFEVVFTTAHSRYALNAFKNEAIDFLLKPLDDDELDRVIRKCKAFFKQNELEDKLQYTFEKVTLLEQMNKKIKFSIDGKLLFFEPDEIIYIQAKGNYCTVYLADGKKILLTAQLGLIENELPKSFFYRTHNSYIINLNKIKSYHKKEALIELSNLAYVPVARPKRMEIMYQL